MNPASEAPAGGTHRKPSSASSPGKAGARGDRGEHVHDNRSTVSVSSLRSRLGPTIRYGSGFQPWHLVFRGKWWRMHVQPAR